MEYQYTRYNYLEPVLQLINGVIALPRDEVRRNNEILKEIIDKLVSRMKRKDRFFRVSFRKIIYAGSYYCGTKVGKPKEYDLVFEMKLPELTDPILESTDIHGYVKVRLRGYENFLRASNEVQRWSKLGNFVDRKYYLLASKISSEFESIIDRALNTFPKHRNGSSIFDISCGRFMGKIHKGGPAYTLKLKGSVGAETVSFDVDLVPSFVLGEERWPRQFYFNPVQQQPNFLIVPKKPGKNGGYKRYWRLSFQDQENTMIKGLGRLKPAIRLIKKLQEKLDQNVVSSYCIKTIFLWKASEDDINLWNRSLSYVFMTMLKRYKEYIEERMIPYFWDDDDKLLQLNNFEAIQNLAYKLRTIINDIENNPDELAVARQLLKRDEFSIVEEEYYAEEDCEDDEYYDVEDEEYDEEDYDEEESYENDNQYYDDDSDSDDDYDYYPYNNRRPNVMF